MPASDKKFGLQRARRIDSTQNILEILKRGKKISLKGVTLRFLDQKLSHPRLGMILSKKKFPWLPSETGSNELGAKVFG